jgi:hypothetical protein
VGASAIHVQHTDASAHAVYVDVSFGDFGGWNVSAILDGRVVEVRNCYDWHRVERMAARMESELRLVAPGSDLGPR